MGVLLLGFIRVGDWISTRKEMEHIHASWIMPTVGAFVMALVGPTLAASYRQAAYLWWVCEPVTAAPRLPAWCSLTSNKVEPMLLMLRQTQSTLCPACDRFAFALLLWIPLFTITLLKTITGANADDRLRPQLFIWVAAPALACTAWVSMIGNINAAGLPAFDPVAKIFMYMALSLAFCLGKPRPCWLPQAGLHHIAM